MSGTHVMEENTPWGWIAAACSTLLAMFTSAIAFLFKGQVTLYEERIASGEKRTVQLEEQVAKFSTAIDKCHEDHKNTQLELATLKGRMSAIEECQKH